METLDGHAAIHTNELAGYVTRRLACKEVDRGRDILGSAERAERDARDRAFADLLAQMRRHVGLDESRSDRIHRLSLIHI